MISFISFVGFLEEVKLFTAEAENTEKASFDVTEYYHKRESGLLLTLNIPT